LDDRTFSFVHTMAALRKVCLYRAIYDVLMWWSLAQHPDENKK